MICFRTNYVVNAVKRLMNEGLDKDLICSYKKNEINLINRYLIKQYK
jgi:hypothetical protein